MLGRGSVSINSGGEKIYPEEVEGRGQVASRRLRRPRRRRARRALGQPCRRGRGAASGTRPSLADIVDAARKEIAGYKVPRSLWLVDEIKRSPAGKPDYKWATAQTQSREADDHYTTARRLMHTDLAEKFGIQYPIFGFTPSEHVAAAISRAGGLGVLGCVRFNDPEELEATLTWMDENTDGKPYGVDIVMPAKVPTEGAAVDLDKLIPAEHRAFVDRTLDELGVPPCPTTSSTLPASSVGCLGGTFARRRRAEPSNRVDRQCPGSPPKDVIDLAHEKGVPVAALAGAGGSRAQPRRERCRHRDRAGLRGRRAHR